MSGNNPSLKRSVQGAPLSPRLMSRLSAAAVRVRYQDGVLIHARGDAKPGLSIVHSGSVRFSNPGLDGSVITTGTLGPGQFFGEATLFAGLPRTHDAVAAGPTVIDQLSKKRFDQIFDEEPDLARMMLQAMTQRLYLALDFMDDLRRLPLKARVAKLIATRTAISENKNSLKASQSELAFTLGVSRVSMGKALGALQKEGIIKLGYGRVEIPDRAKLKSWIAETATLQTGGPE